MKIITLVIAAFIYQTLSAQHASRVVIGAGKRVSEVLTPDVLFLYKQFKPGRILLKDNVAYNAQLNYNLFNGEIMFASPSGDTLALNTEQMLNIKRVSIDSDSYVYNKGYLQIIKENAFGSLGRKQQYYVVSREKIGGYDLASPASSIDSYTSFSDRANSRHDLVVRENISLVLKTEFFIGDPYNLFLPINKKNLEKIFFKKRDLLDSYLKEHEVDFKNEKQLTALFIYLTEGS
ncbi:hypothetical protein [Segetibacter aerophilus]|uniref:Uncharacterized protein n=1 Tax=Segetibacter aerophilus TaxID=670293 RepID=A0A512B6D5_9BACT|nr:hypothetical protein [Segetibacter aerophilus]GEO07522.1 hypothetical protein SAE01_00180 [Segetibacter aerophilus]